MIDLKKKYRCRDESYDVEVLATDMDGRYPVLVRVRKRGETWLVSSMTKDGKVYSDDRQHPYDLIEVSEDDLWDEQFLRELGMHSLDDLHVMPIGAKRYFRVDVRLREWFYCHDGVGGDETPFPPLETRKQVRLVLEALRA